MSFYRLKYGKSGFHRKYTCPLQHYTGNIVQENINTKWFKYYFVRKIYHDLSLFYEYNNGIIFQPGLHSSPLIKRSGCFDCPKFRQKITRIAKITSNPSNPVRRYTRVQVQYSLVVYSTRTVPRYVN